MKTIQLIWIAVGLLGSSAFADIDMQNIRAKLAQSNAGWKAKESWVSRLPRGDMKRLLGLANPPKGDLDFSSAGDRVSGLGLKLDWRDFEGKNWLGAPLNQGNCGSCVAFASIAALEARTSVAMGNPSLHPSFSPQMLFSCGGGACERGWYPSSAGSFLARTGVPDEACMPYTSGSTGEDVECSQKCGDSSDRSVKIIGSTTPSGGFGGSAEAVKQALKSGPLVTTLRVYSDFVTYGSGIYKHVTGEYLGGHAVSIIGYDDTLRAWIIRNSWGPDWGEGGFAKISYDDTSGVGSQTWAYEVQGAQGYVSITSPSDREYVSGVMTTSIESKGLGANQEVAFRIVNTETGQAFSTDPCRLTAGKSICSSKVESSKLKEGRYEIQAVAGGMKSQIREFFVINNPPQMAVSFEGAPGTVLTKPLSGRPEFIIHADFSPVPIQHFEFRVFDINGKIVSVKKNDYVLKTMKMGWRSTSVPNGAYKIQFHGETQYLGKTYSVDSNAVSVTVKN